MFLKNKEKTIRLIQAAQNRWANYIQQIGEAKGNPDEYTRLTKKMLAELYGFEHSELDPPILFKPTLAIKKPVRTTYNETLSYFIGGEVEEDTGFALTPWEKVEFHNDMHITVVDSHCVLAMGRCTFYNSEQKPQRTTADYTFGYRLVEGKLVIFLHHSSRMEEPSI